MGVNAAFPPPRRTALVVEVPEAEPDVGSFSCAFPFPFVPAADLDSVPEAVAVPALMCV